MRKNYEAPALTVEEFKLDTSVTAIGSSGGIINPTMPWYFNDAKQGNSGNNKECWSAINNLYYYDVNDLIYCNG